MIVLSVVFLFAAFADSYPFLYHRTGSR